MPSWCSGCLPRVAATSACGRLSARSPTFAAHSGSPRWRPFASRPRRDQLQIDFGQKRLQIAGVRVGIFLLVVVLSYSRRLFVKAFLNERGDDWREGIAAACAHFGGVPRTLLGDNARAFVLGRDRATGTVRFHPAYLAFCRDWDVQPRRVRPVSRADQRQDRSRRQIRQAQCARCQAFDSFGALEQHLAEWMTIADQRYHGTTREAPIVRFERDERAALRPLPLRAYRGGRSACACGWRTTPSSTSIRSATACRTTRPRPRRGARRGAACASSTAPSWWRRTPDPRAACRVVDEAHYAGLWRGADDRPAAGRRSSGATSPTTPPSSTVAMSDMVHARVASSSRDCGSATSPSVSTLCSARRRGRSRPISTSSTVFCERSSTPSRGRAWRWASRSRISRR